jgi:transcriptional regulator GlxA family with amidase domain
VRGAARRIIMVLYDGVRLLDVTGPLEVFAIANECGGSYELITASLDGSDVTATGGLRLGATTALAEVRGRIDTLIVPGAPEWQASAVDPRLLAEVRRFAALARRTASVCAGAFPLAAAGLLKGKRAATHWNLIEALAHAYPSIEVDRDAIFVRDGKIITSAGITSGIDLCLSLVEEDLGAEVARTVAKHLVVFMARPGGQSQYSVRMSAGQPRHELLRKLLDDIATDPAADHSLGAMAGRVNVSPRQLSRLFRAELGTTPAGYVEQARVEAAKAMLEGGVDAVEVIARRTGLGTAETMRRAFVRTLGVTPRAYRDRFRTTTTTTTTPGGGSAGP